MNPFLDMPDACDESLTVGDPRSTDRWLQEQYEGIARARRLLAALRQWDEENDRPAHYDHRPSGAAA